MAESKGGAALAVSSNPPIVRSLSAIAAAGLVAVAGSPRQGSGQAAAHQAGTAGLLEGEAVSEALEAPAQVAGERQLRVGLQAAGHLESAQVALAEWKAPRAQRRSRAHHEVAGAPRGA